MYISLKTICDYFSKKMKAIGFLSSGKYELFRKEAWFSNCNGFRHDGLWSFNRPNQGIISLVSKNLSCILMHLVSKLKIMWAPTHAHVSSNTIDTIWMFWKNKSLTSWCGDNKWQVKSNLPLVQGLTFLKSLVQQIVGSLVIWKRSN